VTPMQVGRIVGRLNHHLGWFQSMDEARALCEWLDWTREQLIQEMYQHARIRYTEFPRPYWLPMPFPDSLEAYVKQCVDLT